MGLFDLKLMLSSVVPFDTLVASSKVCDTDNKISGLVKDFEYDSEKVRQLRQQNRAEIMKLQRAVTRVAERDTQSSQRETLADIKKYEQSMRKQLYDIVRIIVQLKKLIENEYLEIIYDLRNPLVLFEEFFRQLRTSLKGVSIPSEAKKDIKTILEDVEASYQKLVDHTLQFVENDFKYLSSIGLEFDKFNKTSKADYDLTRHLQERSQLKKQINGKTQWIVQQIRKLEDVFRQLVADKQLDKKVSDVILQNIGYFRKEFEGLVAFCTDRVDVANNMIVEAVTVQKEKYSELLNLKQELESFYVEFLSEQDRVLKEELPKWKTDQVRKRIALFESYQKEVKEELERFEKIFERQVAAVETKDIGNMRIEQKEVRKVAGRIGKLKQRFKKFVIITTIGLSLVGGTIGAGAAISPAFRDSLVTGSVFAFSKSTRFVAVLLSVDRGFAERYGQKDIRFRIADAAVKRIEGADRYMGTNAPSWLRKYPAIKKSFREIDCISFVNDALKDADRNHVIRDRMDKVIADYAAKGWKVYFVCKDLNDKSTFLKGQTGGDFMRAAQQGRYPYLGKISNFVIGEEQVHDFQKQLKGKVALVSFNTGFHSAFILDGNVVQAHYSAIGGFAVEGLYSLEGHMSAEENGTWEFAVVAVAPSS